MYRIQAHNIKTGRIEVIIVATMDERMQRIKELLANTDYGRVTYEYSARGSFSY